MKSLSHSVPVLICGAGPVGLSLAAYLGKQGVETLLVERQPNVQGSAKMIVVSVRTMEFCRQLGIAEDVRDWGFPLDHGLDSVFVTGLQGHELGRVHTPSLRTEYDTPFSPERERPCPQTWFDPILKQYVEQLPSVDVRYQTALEGFEQDDLGVTATLRGADGEFHQVRARYMVGADGYASTVRRLLGVQIRGAKRLDVSMSIYLTIPDLASQHSIGEAYRYLFVGEEGVWCVLTTMDGHDLYRLQIIGVEDELPDAVKLDTIIKRCIGSKVPYTLGEMSSWIRKSTVADRFQDGNVFIAGDAAHAHPPNGGLGMNTGILDSWDLGWKLTAMLQGWGGQHLMLSYDVERRPASARATEESLRNYGRLVDKRTVPGLDLDTPEAALLRKETGARMVEANEKAWHPVGIHLSYVYAPSPVIVDDGSPLPSDDESEYHVSACPGCRAPHFWLEQGRRSILDTFGPGFTLLQFAPADVLALEHAAAAVGMPLSVVPVNDGVAARLYGRNFVLVRPDGYVCWRGDALPAEPRWLVDKVRGGAPAGAPRWQRPTQEQLHNEPTSTSTSSTSEGATTCH